MHMSLSDRNFTARDAQNSQIFSQKVVLGRLGRQSIKMCYWRTKLYYYYHRHHHHHRRCTKKNSMKENKKENNCVPCLTAVRYKHEFTHIWLWKIMSRSLWQSDINRKSPIYGCGKSWCPFPYGSQIHTGIHRYMAVENYDVLCLMAVRYKQEIIHIWLCKIIMSLSIWYSETNRNSSIYVCAK